MNDSRRNLVYAAVAAISLASIWLGTGEVALTTGEDGKPDTLAKLGGIGATLLISAILIERVIELLVGAPRERAKIDNPAATTEAFRQETMDQARRLGLLLGVILAFVGVRTLTQLFEIQTVAESGAEGEPSANDPSFQFKTLTVLDVFLTGALIGGGSAGIHNILSMLTGALKPRPTPEKPDSNFAG